MNRKIENTEDAMAIVRDYFDMTAEDWNELSAAEEEAAGILFARAIHYLGDESRVYLSKASREFNLYLADKLWSDFPFTQNYDAQGNWTGPVPNENGWTA